MHRLIFLLVIMIAVIPFHVISQPWNEHGRLVVPEDNPHYLKYADGTPFFWLGDTGWEMLHRLSRDEINVYFNNRETNGFNVIQAVVISEFIHSDKAVNFYNDSVFFNEDPLRPAITPGNEASDEKQYDYWDHVDYAVSLATKFGLYIALVPTWGEWVIPRIDKPLFNTGIQAYEYGRFLGERYGRFPNIIWVLGGDRHPDERKEGVQLWRAMAEGLADGTNRENSFDGSANYSTTLMTHHSYNSSSGWFQKDEWIDFHMWGSYHAEIDNPRSWELALKDWQLPSPKPTINGEPCYEGHGINYAIDDNGYFTSTDVRMAAYWSAFSGCAGFTYGAQSVWQFTDENRPRHSSKTLMNWQEALDLPGAIQMKYYRNLMESALQETLTPDQRVIVSDMGSCGNYAAAICSESKIMIYIPTGKSITVNTAVLQTDKLSASWFDPRTGKYLKIDQFENGMPRKFDVPGMSESLNWLRSGRGCDWVLIIEKTEF